MRLIYLFYFVFANTNVCLSITELDDRIIELKDSNAVLVMVDVTKYSSVGDKFKIRGFPTIKYIKGDYEVEYFGERAEQDIIDFAKRAHNPPVRIIPHPGTTRMMHREHYNDIIFMYCGEFDESPNSLYTNYTRIARNRRLQSTFYAAEKREYLDQFAAVMPEGRPVVEVWKDGQNYRFKAKEYAEMLANKDDLDEDENEDYADSADNADLLDSWINDERFFTFHKGNGAVINEMASLGKRLVILTIGDEQTKSPRDKRIKEMLYSIAHDHSQEYKSLYQFVWLTDLYISQTITLSEISSPNIVVYEAWSKKYYLPSIAAIEISRSEFRDFLYQIREGNIRALGGTGVSVRIRQIIFNILTTITGIYRESRILFAIMFALPSFIVMFFCYCLCCMDFDDESAPESYDDSEDSDEPVDELQNEESQQIPSTDEATSGHLKAE